MSRRPGSRSFFFSSLRQVEKRLKMENPSSSTAPSSPQPSQPVQATHKSTGSLGSPLYICTGHESNWSSACQESEPPCEFLSNSPGFLSTHEELHAQSHESHPNVLNQYNNKINDIELLMQLLGLPDSKEEGLNDEECETCCCDGGFYEKIVGIKGPKCAKEMQRLEGWIRCLGSKCDEEKAEPLRLAHLLLGKAAIVSMDGGCFEGLQFPSSVQEFLHNDPLWGRANLEERKL